MEPVCLNIGDIVENIDGAGGKAIAQEGHDRKEQEWKFKQSPGKNQGGEEQGVLYPLSRPG